MKISIAIRDSAEPPQKMVLLLQWQNMLSSCRDVRKPLKSEIFALW